MDNVSLGDQDNTEEGTGPSHLTSNRLPVLEKTLGTFTETTSLPPLITKQNARKNSISPSTISTGSHSIRSLPSSLQNPRILHLSSTCVHSDCTDDDFGGEVNEGKLTQSHFVDIPQIRKTLPADSELTSNETDVTEPIVQRTRSNLAVVPEVTIESNSHEPLSYSESATEMETLLKRSSSNKKGTISEPIEALPYFNKSKRPSFAGYHVCRKRSKSVPIDPKTLPKGTLLNNERNRLQSLEPDPTIARSQSSARNLHRTVSGLGIMGEFVVEEEENKSKVIALFEPDINNNQLKRYYNGMVGILEDRQRQDRILHEEKKFVIHPLSTFRLIWDSVLLLAIFMTMILLPFKISFYRIFDEGMDLSKEFWYTTIIFIDIIFFVDVVLNFFTGSVESKINPPRINLNRKEIQIQYIKTWFIPDILSSIPFDIIGSELSNSAQTRALTFGASKMILIAKVLKIFSLIRILRLGRLHYITKRWIQIFEISPLIMKIFQLFVYFFLIAHWSGCFQFFVVYCRGFPETSWPVKLNIQNSPVEEQYIWSFFRSLSHMLTIGYGKDPPSDTIEVLLIIPSMLIGAFFYMMIVSQMTKTISMFRVGDIRYTQKLKEVDEFTKKFSLGCDIHQRMHEFYHHKYGGEIHEEDEIIKELPLSLRIDVIKARMHDLLDNVFFFKKGCEGFIEQCILSAKTAVFMTGDIIVRSEDTVEDLYIIAKGTVSIEFTTEGSELKDEIIVRSYGFFGETPMLLHRTADMMVYAETPCDFYLVPQFIFYSLIERYPLFKHQMLLVTHSRIKLQGLDPMQHAPHLAASFLSALGDKTAIDSTEDILELASQSALNPAMMEAFRNRNSTNYSVFRKQVAHKKGETVPSTLTPIVNMYNDHKENIHVSVSIHDDRSNSTKISKEHIVIDHR